VQARQALANVVAVLAEAGGRPEHLVRLTWYVVDRDEYVASLRALGAAYREVVGRHYPAMTAVEVSALIEPRARSRSRDRDRAVGTVGQASADGSRTIRLAP
jgi:enamine deaminase RidA (YjgF/YER057c/UK114 family)